MTKLNSVYEILDTVQRAQTQEERIALLKQHNCLAVRDVLRAAYDDSIVFNLPKGIPPYNNNLSKEGHSPTNLLRCTTQFTYFVKRGKGDELTPAKRESVFLRLLEGIHPRDAEIVCAIKDKTLQEKYPGITKELVKTVWPKLILS